MKTKIEIITALSTLAPSVCLETIWEHDNDAIWDIADPTLCEEDFRAWQSTVKARAVSIGIMHQGLAYMGGTWEKFGDKPEESNPDISGYFPQMAQEALRELSESLPEFNAEQTSPLPVQIEIGRALAYLK